MSSLLESAKDGTLNRSFQLIPLGFGRAETPPKRPSWLRDGRRPELDAANGALHGLVSHQRYRPDNWSGVTNWRRYDEAAGEGWHGFDAVRDLDGLPPCILMVPLAGHTLGHAGVAIDTSAGWLLHAGDAYLHRNELAAGGSPMPPGLAVYERIMMADSGAAKKNLGRLQELHAAEPDIRIICSHDTRQFELSYSSIILQGRENGK